MMRTTPSFVFVLLVTVALALAGCGSSGDTQGSGEAKQPEPRISYDPIPPASYGQPDGYLGLPPSRVDWWSTDIKITAPTFTKEEALALRKKRALQAFEGEAIPPDLPEVPFTKFYPGEESARLQAECLTEQGFPALVANIQGFFIEVPESQSNQFDRAWYVCMMKYPLEPQILATQEFSRDQWAIQYDYWSEAFLPCLESLGREYTEEPTPSREVFIADMMRDPEDDSPPKTQWAPYTVLTGEDQRARAACPINPPLDALYGKAQPFATPSP